MNFTDEVTIAADRDRVWEVFTDVERWPEWTDSVRRARWVRGGRVEVGARARIEQPHLPPMVWEVAAVEPGVSWTWVARSPGVRTTAVHRLAVLPDGSTRVLQSIEQSGPLGAVVGRATGRLTRRYLATEGAGLKARCESRPAA
jgi:uncharacterized protein YndB with AHSA1/START domain